MSFVAACIQNCATPDVAHDVANLVRLSRQAIDAGAQFIATPEYCAGLMTRDERVHPVAFPEDDHPAIPALSGLARAHRVWILIGSIGVTVGEGRIANRSIMIDATGAIVARYDKIHLFDVNLGPGRVYRESATIVPGREPVVASCLEGKAGLSICYDLRFAALCRHYAQLGVPLLTIPAAFTKFTGEAHWHILVRARAIENGAFVVAPGQYGTLAGGAQCYGHSLIVDPWGAVLADGGDREGFITAEINLERVYETRRRIPSLQHDRRFGLMDA